MPSGIAELADSTGFSPEGVQRAIVGIRSLDTALEPSDWAPDSLFQSGGRIADLFGVMLNVPQLTRALEEIAGHGGEHVRISEITTDWVNGHSIEQIARKYFVRKKDDKYHTDALTDACRAIYRSIANSATWGVSALSRMADFDFEKLSDAKKREINTLPAMIYHGVRSEDAVLMRMNSAPRTVAEELGTLYREINGESDSRFSVSKAREFLVSLHDNEWDRVRPSEAPLSGSGYKRVWEVLSGEAT